MRIFSTIGKGIIVIAFSLIMNDATAFASPHNLNITDYDTATSEARRTYINLTYNNSSYFDKTSSIDYYYQRQTLDLRHDYFYDSLNKSVSYGIEAIGSTRSVSHQGDSLDYSGNINLSYNEYFDPNNNRYHGIAIQYLDQTHKSYHGPWTPEIIWEDAMTTLSYVIGCGHLIDITPLADAGVLEDRLIEVGILKDRLSKEDMLKLAELIRKYQMGEYGYKNPDTGKGKYLEDISRVLENSNLVNGSLNGFGFWRISEQSSVNYQRFKGSKVELSLNNQSIVDYVQVPDYSAKMFRSDQGCVATLKYLTYLPFDWRSQCKLEAAFSVSLTPHDIWDPYHFLLGIPANSYYGIIYYSYDLTNNIWLSASVSYFKYNYTENGFTTTSGTKQYELSANYKIEDFMITSVALRKSCYDVTNYSDESISFTQGIYF